MQKFKKSENKMFASVEDVLDHGKSMLLWLKRKTYTNHI